MKRTMLFVMSVSLGLAGLGNVAVAQEAAESGLVTNADGSHVTSVAGVSPTANGEGGTIIYGDINTGSTRTVISPPSVSQTSPPPAPATAPVAEPAPVASAPVAVATDDQDGDNLIDSREYELGLDPLLADADGDGVADGDEVDLYGTDPWVWDSDGDGIGDGEELFGLQSDPLVWTDASAGGESVAQQAASEVQPFEEAPMEVAQSANEVLTATDGDASALGSGNASASPGTVTRGSGSALLGPDGTYNVTESAPGNVTISGDTEVLAPPAAAPSGAISCVSYATWYDAQVAYEAAGLTAADPTMVQALDPDFDGIACEEGM